MRVLRLRIEDWRNFRRIELAIPSDTPLVCLIGENGTGKSNILELLSAAAHRLGISSGIEMPRGDPFGETHAFTLVLQLTASQVALISPDEWARAVGAGCAWDGTLCLESQKPADGSSTQRITAGSDVDPQQTTGFADHVVGQLRQREETQHLYLDADRAYPPLQLQPHQFAEALTQPYESAAYSRQWAFRPTRTMYEDWIKYFLSREVRYDTEHARQIRRARKSDSPEPSFEDPFISYRKSIQEVLPHLEFVGADTTNRTILFDTAGQELAFSNLSGGEREIAFLIGQMERFQLRRGLLLLDEPELHLNPDLLRTWVAFLKASVQEGQVWLATHSLEAVEVAGPDSTFVMDRAGHTRIVENASPLGTRPVLSVLSAAVGAPAFSISRLRFVYIEGERPTRERERFYQICGEPTVNRFLEAGSCNEVVRKLATIRELAANTGEVVRVGGVIDRDFRTPQQISEIKRQCPVYVLACHEIENFFLHPDAIAQLLRRAGYDADRAQDILRDAADQFAGLWIVQRTATRNPDLSQLTPAVRGLAGPLKWAEIVGDEQRRVGELAVLYGPPALAQRAELVRALSASVEAYKKTRCSPALWKDCMGKQVLSQIPHRLDLSGVEAVERHVQQMWVTAEVALPQEVLELRQYLEDL